MTTKTLNSGIGHQDPHQCTVPTPEPGQEPSEHLVRLHSACHLVELGFRATHDAGPLLASSVTDQQASLRFSMPEPMDSIEVSALRRWVTNLIKEDLPIIIRVDQTLGRRRHWHIDGIGSVPCLGTHPTSTAEIGFLQIGVAAPRRNFVELTVELESDNDDVWRQGKDSRHG